MILRMVVIALAIVLLAARGAAAQGKTDVVTLLNGDRFTCEIVDLRRGRLQVKTDDAGTIDIEWDKVASVVATRQFEVETTDGRRLLGSLGPQGSQMVVVQTSQGDQLLTTAEMTRITVIGAGFWARLEGGIDAGFNYTHSSGVSQTSLNTTVIYRRPAFQFRFSSSASVTTGAEGDKGDGRGNIGLSYVRYRGRRLLIGGATNFETNESLGLLLRSQIGGLAGLRLVSTNRSQLEVGSGVVINDEKGVDSGHTQNVEGLVRLVTSYFLYDSPKTQLDLDLGYYPGLSNWNRHRLQLDSAVRRDLWKDLTMAFNIFYSFDSQPPSENAQRHDFGTVLSLGWSF